MTWAAEMAAGGHNTPLRYWARIGTRTGASNWMTPAQKVSTRLNTAAKEGEWEMEPGSVYYLVVVTEEKCGRPL